MVKIKHFNSRVAASRGSEWRENLKTGKLEARMNPSRIAEIRMARGLRQADIAARLQMSLATYCAVERGKRLIKDILAKHVAAELGVKIGEIFEPPTEETVGGIKWRAIVKKESKNGHTSAKTSRTGVRNTRKSSSKKSGVQRRAKQVGKAI
jgi:transcriptional regulator with XRE-family HTH domain